MKKCIATVTGRHKWRWETISSTSTGTNEVAEKCIYCKYFKGGKTKFYIGAATRKYLV